MRARLLSLFLVAICFQVTYGQALKGKNTFNAGFELLHSTHSTNFPGLSLEFERDLYKYLSAGIGVEYSHGKFHDDNGYDLHRLNFVPLFFTQRVNFFRSKLFVPYLRLREGISFIGYDKQVQNSTGPKVRIKESGFYGYAALGSQFFLKPNLGISFEAGIKSFHISNNNLDVNPHGVTFKLGALYNF